MMRRRIAVALFTLAAVFLAIDAEFHNVLAVLLATLLAATTLFFAWRRRGDPDTNLIAAALAVSSYWVALALSITGLPIDLVAASVTMLVVALATWLGVAPRDPRHVMRANSKR
jgi:hypothetical protein